MTLRADVAELVAGTGVLDVDVEEAVADEHVRWSVYRRVVSAAASSRNRDRDRAIVATILRDPVELVAKSAVVALVDEVAARASGPAEFRRWAAGLLPETDRLTGEKHRAFVRRRVEDWLLHLSVEDGRVPTPAELSQATDWMQRVLAERTNAPAVLALLAESGSTRKIRNIAKNRAGGGAPGRRRGDGSRGQARP
ncbi:hypothetical protein [Streptomyces sp. DH8]|uniref:hypothetical protein n=1 Tax=Streptomyces sp. DH8 TaxID=2857008 RepID=UPI001E3F5DC9|nr:hypothetical protein [Streptomyces sp. DH8]